MSSDPELSGTAQPDRPRILGFFRKSRNFSEQRISNILWFMVYGLWFMVYGLWFMVYGLWFMVYGLWFMV